MLSLLLGVFGAASVLTLIGVAIAAVCSRPDRIEEERALMRASSWPTRR